MKKRISEDKIRIHKRHVILCLLNRHRWNTRETISWTNPLFAESCIIKHRSYVHSYFRRETEKISIVYPYCECYSKEAYKILLTRCVIVNGEILIFYRCLYSKLHSEFTRAIWYFRLYLNYHFYETSWCLYLILKMLIE